MAGIAGATVRVDLGDGTSARQSGISARLGVRICPLCFEGIRWLRVTPHLAFSTTQIAGIDGDEEVGFSYLDRGVETSVRIRAVRFYGFVRSGGHTLERWVGGAPRNYVADGQSRGFGLEVPLTPEGRGIDLGFSDLSGHFDRWEQSDQEFPADLDYKAWSLYLGWSGPLRGAGLPWR